MGLAERRAAKQFEETTLPQLKQALNDAARFDVPVKVDWATLIQDDYAHLFEEAWPKVYFAPLIEAVKTFAEDALGREFLHGALKQVVIKNVAGNSSGSSFASFVDGVLTLDHEPFSNIDDVYDRREGIQRVLEAEPELKPSTDALGPFLDLKSRGVESTLQALLRIAHRRDAGVPLLPPFVTVTTRSGTYFTGVVRDILEDRSEGRSLLLQEHRDRNSNAVVINLNHLEALSVLDTGSLGGLKRDAAPVISQLQLRRQLQKKGERLDTLMERATPLTLTPGADATSAEALRALAFLADQVLAALESFTKDDDARQALLEKVQRVHLRVGADSDVTLSHGTLEFVTSEKPVGWRLGDELKQALPPLL
ncbi:hypothetical protein LZ198_24695 [Myxococcus sp. K15C18031901]|uniref:hypothetical protein n=1 Tax=Myxococcus dinghuensis TaxID=2906761 RepID=UPI0020A7DA64|nr:hypothetical protein [Myxococcus dinghuensis]MCP3102071.1 hypothetical protein [Myxococcus dinghuensis]